MITVNDAMLGALRELAHAKVAHEKAHEHMMQGRRANACPCPSCGCCPQIRSFNDASERFFNAQDVVVKAAVALFAANPKRDGAT